MEEESEQVAGRYANDNHMSDGDNEPNIAPQRQIDRVTLSIASLDSPQIAREQFELLQADNDNALLSIRNVLPEPEVKARNKEDEGRRNRRE